ncbi:CCR4-NOT regulatory complex component [Tulasnella sp. 424]|nr:CCR4-NOT regulatory complex component [Tulasnella sp. 424]KAG8979051.1 CCR4-NOT regulatory complex component [Tulasnella sp. 425]
MAEEAINVDNLTYQHKVAPGTPLALRDLSLHLPKGSRTLLIGANGAGKSTLLQILAGKKMTPAGAKVTILGKDVFRNTPKGVTFLGTEWAMNPVVRSDIVVSAFLDSVGGYRHKERRDKLLDILDVDLDWRMHQISDGERRRVQLVFGLMSPWDVLLLDEVREARLLASFFLFTFISLTTSVIFPCSNLVSSFPITIRGINLNQVTVDLDVLVRSDLLAFLKSESESRGATILYATHIFDGISHFPTHVAHMRDGAFLETLSWPPPAAPQDLSTNDPEIGEMRAGSALHGVALQWLKEDREVRRQAEASGVVKKTRGARTATDVPTDSETFYKK